MNEENRKFLLLKNKILTQISNHKEEMNKRNSQSDFYEGRMIEAEVMLRWFEDSYSLKKGNSEVKL